MFDVQPTELLILGVVAILVIPPKDLPRAMRMAGHWIGRARGVARQFRSGFDEMIREAELAEMEKRWKEENERILREHPSEPTGTIVDHSPPEPEPEPEPGSVPEQGALPLDEQPPVMVEQPRIVPADKPAAPNDSVNL